MLICVTTSLSVFATNQDSLSNHGNKNRGKVQLNLDSLKFIGTEVEQPVMEDIFIQLEHRRSSKVELIIYGQNLSEPREEQSFEVL